jgi:hypothetical protein
MTKKREQELKKMIRRLKFSKEDYTKTASVFAYVQLSPKYGVKFFKRRKLCEDAFIRQRASHFLGIAPEAYFMVRKGFRWGYVTRHADTEKYGRREDINRIRQICDSMGWCTTDIDVDYNVGYVDGRLVLIDFDDATLT